MAVSGMMTAMKSLILLCLAATVAFAAPKPKKYHFELTKVLVKPEVKAEVGATAQPRVEAAIKKAFESHPQLVQTLEGAPDPEADHGQTYRKYLTKKGIAGAYLVTVEITDASEEVVPMEDKKNSQRLVVHVGIHVLGETIPGRTMGFTGDGQATVKQEVGMKIRDKDRTYAWDGAAETAVDDALKTCFEQLAKPQKKQ
jgi:lipoprotein-anchoring transpeptidase ErfK/SrfK